MQVELRVQESVPSSGKTETIPEWLDEDFLQLCMQSGEADPTIRVMNHNAVLFRIPKDDCGAIIYRVSVQFKRRPRSRNILDFKPQEVRWIVVKMVAHPDDATETQRKSLVFDKEITAMSSTVPAIGKLYGLLQFTAQCFYSERSPRAMIVMEDLAKSDFISGKMDRARGLDYDHCVLVLQSMAALHAGSVALYENNKSSMDAYNGNIWTENEGSSAEDLVANVVNDVADEVSGWQNFGDKYANRIRHLKDTLMKRVRRCVSRDESGFNVLNHGHCWYNNLMFRYHNSTSRVKEVLFLDFQESIFTSPVIDLQHFLYSSATDEVRLQNYSRLIQHYHKHLLINFNKLKIETKPPTLDELVEEIDSRGSYGLWVAFTLLPIVLEEGSNGVNILKNPNAVNERRKMYANEQYKTSLKRLLQIFDSKGLLD